MSASARRKFLVATGTLLVAFGYATDRDRELSELEKLRAAPHRTERNVRDRYRHPVEVTAFFGIRPDSTVVEILPGSAGYYMEILLKKSSSSDNFKTRSKSRPALSGSGRRSCGMRGT